MSGEARGAGSLADLAAAAGLIAVGVLGFVLALDFDEASRAFPAAMSGLLALTGLAIGGLAIARRAAPSRQPAGGLGSAGLAAAALLLWALGLSVGGGFVAPTFLLQCALLWITGLRRPPACVAVAAAVTGGAYLLFALGLDVPLPAFGLPS